MSFIVCRHNEAASCDFTAATLEVMSNSKYKQKAPLESAPDHVDCLTLVHFLFAQSMKTRIPLTHIGNMVGQLNACKEWRVLEIAPEELQNGDLLFAEKVEEEGAQKFTQTAYITHVGIFLQLSPHAPKRILHTTKMFKRPVFHTFDVFRKFYKQTLDTKQAIHHIDHRDSDRRRKGQFDIRMRAFFRQVALDSAEAYNGVVPSPSPREWGLTASRSSSREEGDRPGSTPPGVRIRTPTPRLGSRGPSPISFAPRTHSIGNGRAHPSAREETPAAALRRPLVSLVPPTTAAALIRSTSDRA